MFAAKSDAERSGRNRNPDRSKSKRLRQPGPGENRKKLCRAKLPSPGESLCSNGAAVSGFLTPLCVQRLMRFLRCAAPLLKAAADSPTTRIALGSGAWRHRRAGKGGRKV
jgi:hypothetical protein